MVGGKTYGNINKVQLRRFKLNISETIFTGGQYSPEIVCQGRLLNLQSEVFKIQLSKAMVYMICCQKHLCKGWILDQVIPKHSSSQHLYDLFYISVLTSQICQMLRESDSFSHFSLVAGLGNVDCWQTFILQLICHRSLLLHTIEPQKKKKKN